MQPRFTRHHRPTAFFSFLLLALWACTNDSPSIKAQAKPWATTTKHDFGQVFTGKTLTHTFKFKNPTNKPQRLMWMEKTCACAKAWVNLRGQRILYSHVVRNPITVKAGEEWTVTIKLDLNGIVGVERGGATIGTTDPHNRALKCSVIVKVLPHFTVKPRGFNAGKVNKPIPIPFQAKITNNHQADWKILEILPPNDITLAEPKPFRSGDKYGFLLQGTITPTTKHGGLGGTILIKTNFQGETIEIPVTAEFMAPFSISPERILSFGIVDIKRGAKRTITITSNTDAPLALTETFFDDLSVSVLCFKVTPQKATIKDKLVIEVTILPKCLPGRLAGDLYLVTTSPKRKITKIGLSGFVK